jgi:hypothetical protein
MKKKLIFVFLIFSKKFYWQCIHLRTYIKFQLTSGPIYYKSEGTQRSKYGVYSLDFRCDGTIIAKEVWGLDMRLDFRRIYSQCLVQINSIFQISLHILICCVAQIQTTY